VGTVQAIMHLRTAHRYANRIALSIRRKFLTVAKLFFADATCVTVDTGSAVVNRKAARLSGRHAAERNAIVIDRFFDTKKKALAWANAHPHFMTVRILTPASKQETKLVATKGSRSSPTNVASSVKTSRAGLPDD
jgi:hypothetical protein